MASVSKMSPESKSHEISNKFLKYVRTKPETCPVGRDLHSTRLHMPLDPTNPYSSRGLDTPKISSQITPNSSLSPFASQTHPLLPSLVSHQPFPTPAPRHGVSIPLVGRQRQIPIAIDGQNLSSRHLTAFPIPRRIPNILPIPPGE